MGGTDVRDYTQESLMNQISMVFQNVYLFADTIENNIKFGCPDATHEQVVEAARRACCDDSIEVLPDGYDTLIGEGGASLSGGEKQRLSIARALARKPEILVFDDSFSALDFASDRKLRKALAERCGDVTKLIVAQRVSTVRDADLAVVLDGGACVGAGTHDELMRSCQTYQEIVSS